MENTFAVANYFVQKSFNTGIPLTPMKLVKLVYVAHGWYLGLTGEPLLNEPVQAWKYGPVIESVYKEFKDYGDQQITRLASEYQGYQIVTPQVEDVDIKLFLDKVWDVYKTYSGPQLSTLTHQADTPWSLIWNIQGGSKTQCSIIPNDLIKKHYKDRIITKQASVMAN